MNLHAFALSLLIFNFTAQGMFYGAQVNKPPVLIFDEIDPHINSTEPTSKSHYSQRFTFLPDSSPFKQTCSKINENKEINDACTVLSNFLYCMQHPYNPERPIECQEFCKEYFLANPVFKKTVLSLQKELHLDPKEVVDFMRALSSEAETHRSPELCSTSWTGNLKTKLSEFKNSWWKSEEDEDDGAQFC